MSNTASSASSRKARAVPRVEGVGSLLRPKAITDQIEAIYKGMTTALRPYALAEKPLELQRLNRAVDAEVLRLVQRQIDAGLDVVTDGELRRSSFLSSFYDAASGLGAAPARYEIPPMRLAPDLAMVSATSPARAASLTSTRKVLRAW